MTNILICTGKKKAIVKILDHFKDLDRNKKLEILNLQVISKKVLFIKYEELKILFLSKEGTKVPVPRDLIKKLDNFKISKGQSLMMKMSTFRVEDAGLRWNLMSRATNFKLKGGNLKIDETVEELNYKTFRTCDIVMSGPSGMALDLKDTFVKDRLVDPESIVYTL